jgi:phosphatidylglycerol:prolipoprotein diacylglycerol transferase
VDNVAFELFGFQVYWYGILAAAAFLVAFGTASRRAPRVGIRSEDVFNLAPWIIIGAVVGARVLYVISYWDKEFAGRPWTQIFNMRSGLVYYGGLIGSSLGTIIFCRKARLPLWRMADVMAPSIALGHAFGRVGCFMTGCCYGRPTDLPWAVHFPKEHWTHGIGVHPTQLYESSLNFLFYMFLAWLYRRRKFDGQIFAIYLIGYALIRAFVEFFRGDYDLSQFHFGGLASPGQTVSIFILAAGLALWWKQRRGGTPTGSPAPA